MGTRQAHPRPVRADTAPAGAGTGPASAHPDARRERRPGNILAGEPVPGQRIRQVPWGASWPQAQAAVQEHPTPSSPVAKRSQATRSAIAACAYAGRFPIGSSVTGISLATAKLCAFLYVQPHVLQEFLQFCMPAPSVVALHGRVEGYPSPRSFCMLVATVRYPV